MMKMKRERVCRKIAMAEASKGRRKSGGEFYVGLESVARAPVGLLLNREGKEKHSQLARRVGGAPEVRRWTGALGATRLGRPRPHEFGPPPCASRGPFETNGGRSRPSSRLRASGRV